MGLFNTGQTAGGIHTAGTAMHGNEQRDEATADTASTCGTLGTPVLQYVAFLPEISGSHKRQIAAEIWHRTG